MLKPMDLMVEVSPRRVFANGHTYHINSISVNSDGETYMSADDLRINLWHLAVTDRSFSILSCRGRPGLGGRLAGGFCFPRLWVGPQRVNEGGHEILPRYWRTLKPRLGGRHWTLPSSRVAVIPTVLGPRHPGMEEEMRVRGWPPWRRDS